ncbi:MAG: hypothetical protein U1A23_04485, partial [Candidatus Sungbacteria bacterium]|nr:hypothetical protein [Candidatus Sungbacteria bacterium]
MSRIKPCQLLLAAFLQRKEIGPMVRNSGLKRRLKSLDYRVSFETPGDPKRVPDTVTTITVY